MDEEDSMDGTEITESIGPQDTGEALQTPFFIHNVHFGYIESHIRLELAHLTAVCRECLKRSF